MELFTHDSDCGDEAPQQCSREDDVEKAEAQQAKCGRDDPNLSVPLDQDRLYFILNGHSPGM